MKNELLESLYVFLLREGFTVKSLKSSCFDILARRGSHIVLVKVLEDANSLSPAYAEEMKRISSYIGASPLIIAEKAQNKLEDNVVYARLGIYTLNFKTFGNAVHNRMPFVKRTQAGFTAQLRGRDLRKLREKKNLSLTDVSKKLGVSSRMISRYENDDAEITISRAVKMYEIFGDNVFDKINVLSHETNPVSEFKTGVGRKYSALGFTASETKKAPFDLIAKKEREVILTEIGDKEHKHLSSLSKLLDADNLVIFKKKKPKDIPSMTQKEFYEFKKAEELIKFLREF